VLLAASFPGMPGIFSVDLLPPTGFGRCVRTQGRYVFSKVVSYQSYQRDGLQFLRPWS
jgi:hypothetical protein